MLHYINKKDINIYFNKKTECFVESDVQKPVDVEKQNNKKNDECNINYILKMINKDINIYIFGENNYQS